MKPIRLREERAPRPTERITRLTRGFSRVDRIALTAPTGETIELIFFVRHGEMTTIAIRRQGQDDRKHRLRDKEFTAIGGSSGFPRVTITAMGRRRNGQTAVVIEAPESVSIRAIREGGRDSADADRPGEPDGLAASPTL